MVITILILIIKDVAQGKIITLGYASESSSTRKKKAQRSLKLDGGNYWNLIMQTLFPYERKIEEG